MTTRQASDGHAGDVAHDFNNLLTAIIGAAEAVLGRSGIDSETRDDVAHIAEGARRGAALIRSLHTGSLDFSASHDLISVSETIRATSRLLAHRLGPKIALTLALEDCAAQVRADPSQLDRVLLNLIANARHAMPDGGTVTLSTGKLVLAAAESRVPDTIPPGDYVTITVADTGSGIPRNELPRIFEAGFTSRREAGGSGVGLASVSDITHRVGGFLAVESVEGQGTRFEIYLPRRGAEVERARTARPIGEPGTVLLVEDDPIVKRITERVLQRAGWTVLCAASAEAALETLRQSRCDLMISDVTMPGMDGIALTRLVLARSPEMPVILTSGYQRPDASAEFEHGTVGFLTKPYGQADLLAAVERCFPGPAVDSGLAG